MDATTLAAARATAVVTQLKAEIGVSPFTVKSLAREVGIDYSTMRNYVNGTRQLPVGVLLQSLAAMNVAPETFIARAMARAGESA